MLERAATQASPDTSPALWLGISLAEMGYVGRALRWFERAHAQDPLVSINHGYLGYAYEVVGRDQDALRIVLRGLELNPTGWYWAQLLGIEATNRGDLDLFDEIWDRLGDNAEWRQAVQTAVRDPEARDEFFAAIPAEGVAPNTFRVVMSLLMQDADRLFEAARRTNYSGANYARLAAWLPSLGWLREHPGFYEFMRESGAVDLWEAQGYPAGCRPVDDPAGRRLDCSEYAP
jgi:tetratricopeptide (TPR) repeat protein